MQNAKKALQNAPSPSDGQGDEKPTDASEGILEAFAKDTSEAGKAVQELLNALDKGEAASSPLVKEKASALLSRLPSLLPDDPALAAVIAEAMAGAFGEVKPKGEGEGLTQEEAERIYEEIMSK